MVICVVAGHTPLASSICQVFHELGRIGLEDGVVQDGDLCGSHDCPEVQYTRAEGRQLIETVTQRLRMRVVA